MKLAKFISVLILIIVSITWVLVRADIIEADIIRFLPAALGLVVAISIAYILLRERHANKDKNGSTEANNED